MFLPQTIIKDHHGRFHKSSPFNNQCMVDKERFDLQINMSGGLKSFVEITYVNKAGESLETEDLQTVIRQFSEF